MNTTRGNFEGYTKKKVKASHEAYKIRGHTGNIFERDLARVVCNQSVMNCDITLRALSNANEIFGPHLPSVRGETVLRQSQKGLLPREYESLGISNTFKSL